MARLSRLSRQLRRFIEHELPGTKLDDNVINFFASILDGEADEEELAEIMSPFLTSHLPLALESSASSAHALCRKVVRRFRGAAQGDPAAEAAWELAPPALSRESSGTQRNASELGVGDSVDGGVLENAPSTETTTEGHATVCWGLSEWLERLALTQYATQAREWCAGTGAAYVEEVMENWAAFSDDLGLKPLERRRVWKDCASCAQEVTPEETEESSLSSRLQAEPPPVLASTRPMQRAVAAPWAQVVQPNRGGGEVQSSARGNGAGAGCDEGRPAPHTSPRMLQARNIRRDTFGKPGDPYTILNEIGAGATATVYRCTRGDQIYAVKAISLKSFRMQRDFASIIERLHRETAILFSLRHSCIVSLFDAYETKEKLYLVMEFVEGGELFNDIIRNGSMGEHEARYVFLQIVLGLTYIHSKGVVHRDLKPQNVLVARGRSRPGLLQVKISDFGHSKLVDDGYSTPLSVVGTPLFWAPEVADTSVRSYDERVDLWSLGALLYVMLEGRYPFDGTNSCELRFRSDSTASEAARDLIRGLLQRKPQDRLPLASCLEHPWVVTASGPLAQVVALCEEADDRRQREYERRVVLPGDPKDVRQLRRDLQLLTIKFKIAVTLDRRCEVCIRFHNEARKRAERARGELMRILKGHFSDGILDTQPERTVFARSLGAREELAPVAEVACESEAAFGQNQDDELGRHDEELQALSVAFPDSVEASAIGEFGSVPRIAHLCLRDGGRVLRLAVLLPRGYPVGAQLELTSMEFKSKCADESASHLMAEITAQLQKEDTDLMSLAAWLQGDVLPRLASSAVSMQWKEKERQKSNGGLPATTSVLSCAGSEAPATGSSAPADVADAGAASAMGQVRCQRLYVIIPQLDERNDLSTTMCSGGGKACLSKKSFFTQFRQSFPEVSGILSCGKPAFLLAEGPQEALAKMVLEVSKLPWWWDVIERPLTNQEDVNVGEIAAWRAFRGFTNVKSDELQQTLERAGRPQWYDTLVQCGLRRPKQCKHR